MVPLMDITKYLMTINKIWWLSLGLTATTIKVSAQKPNFLILLTDDQGYADLFANLPDSLKPLAKYDEVWNATPNMSHLAVEGVLFTNAYSNGNTCSPTRAGLMIGRYEQRTGLWDTPESRGGLPLDETTMADVLRGGGYATGMFGKWHLGLAPQYNPLERGFDYFYGFMGHGSHPYYDLTIKNPIYHNNMMRNYEPIDEGTDNYLTDRIAEETIEFIEKNKSNPFFAYVCFNAVHSPSEAPKEGPFATDSKDTRDITLSILGRMDYQIGKILDALDDNGLSDNTFIVLMSDNGGAGGMEADNTPLKGSKGTYWEGGIRVPLIMKWPDKLKGLERFEEMVMGFDIFPTFVAAAGLSMPNNGKIYDGKNILPWLTKIDSTQEKTGKIHDVLHWDQDGGEADFAVRKGDWKLNRQKGVMGLYNLAKDLGEQNNLYDSNKIKVNELQAIRDEWLKEMKPPIASNQGCMDKRYEEYRPDFTRHNEEKCLTLIEKKGCRDPYALNFDYTVTDHKPSLCEYEEVAIGMIKNGPGIKKNELTSFSDLKENALLRVFSPQGKLLCSVKANDVSRLTFKNLKVSGVYIIQIIENGKTLFAGKRILTFDNEFVMTSDFVVE